MSKIIANNFNFQQPKSIILQIVSFKLIFFVIFLISFMFSYYKINEKKGVGKKKNQRSKGENIYKDNNKFTSRPNAKNKNWMETIIAFSNKHQSPSNNQG